MAAGAPLKSLYETCVAHLLHNCAIIRVTSHFGDGDQLIAKAKSETVKSKTKQAKFATIGCSSQPDISIWLNASLY